MPIEPVVSVRGRFQTSYFDVTLLATERGIDAVVADETIRHVREIVVADFIRAIEPSMASGTRVCGVEIGTMHIGGFPQVGARINCFCEYRADVIQLRVQRVVELRDSYIARSFDLF